MTPAMLNALVRMAESNVPICRSPLREDTWKLGRRRLAPGTILDLLDEELIAFSGVSRLEITPEGRAKVGA